MVIILINISKVENLINEKGWKKAYFCRLFNHSRTWIDDWKRGRGLPDENVLQEIADKLNTTVEYLTDKSEQKNKPSANLAESLSKEDAEVLKLFRQLSADGQKIAMAQLDAMLSVQKDDSKK